jgi:hypothetical protein
VGESVTAVVVWLMNGGALRICAWWTRVGLPGMPRRCVGACLGEGEWSMAMQRAA